MKNLKVLLVVSICAIGFSPLFSQQDVRKVKSPEERSEQRTAKMTEELNLTQDQAVKLAKINEKYAKEREILAKENRKQREENRNAMRKLNESQNDEIKAILTPAQMEKMNDLKEERLDARKSRGYEMKGKKMERSGQK